MKKYILLITTVFITSVFAQPYGGWKEVDSLNIPRVYHSAVVLPNGNVMVSGGENGPAVESSTEFYDVILDEWEIGPPMLKERSFHHLMDIGNNEILVFGGSEIRVSEIYSLDSNSFRYTDSISAPRAFSSSAVKLLDGRILFTGGFTLTQEGSSYYKLAEIFNPATEQWSLVDSMHYLRGNHTSTLLPDGRVIVTGGVSRNQVEVYDPISDSWHILASMNTQRQGHGAVLLPDSRLFVAGGFSNDSVYGLYSCEVYDFNTNEWNYVSPMVLPNNALNMHLSLMNDSLLFIRSLIGTEIYNINRMQSVYAAINEPAERYNQVGVILDDGSRMFIAGDAVDGMLIYQTKNCYQFRSGLITNLSDPPYIKKVFYLSQNYPNPFNPVTKINYTIRESGLVSIRVYNVVGEEVADLVNEAKNPGSYSVEFDATTLPSGIYFYTLRTNNYVETKKMILMK